MTLHEAIRQVLIGVGEPMTTAALADSINEQKTYRRKDGLRVTPFQVHGRSRIYPHLFSQAGATISLAEWNMPIGNELHRANLFSSGAEPANDLIASSALTSEAALLNDSAFRKAGSVDALVPDAPGVYAIRVRNKASLPDPFALLSATRGHDLLYIGIARSSLRRRFLGQELRAQGHGTFFRSIGAVLGYRPTQGSLIGKKNTRNFKFIEADESSVMTWINSNLLVNWITIDEGVEELELRLLREHSPLLNLRGNPAKLAELSALREECVRIANSVR
jgi:hypothetical protein